MSCAWRPSTTGNGSGGAAKSTPCWSCCSSSAWCSPRTARATPRLCTRCGSSAGSWSCPCRAPGPWRRPRSATPAPRSATRRSAKSHRAILARAPADNPRWLWRGHRAFAVDGSKLNLPRPLLHNGYRTPSDSSHYPQGLLSCLYQLRARLPLDIDLSSHGNERAAALTHLPALRPGDVVVYDRGYYSFLMLHAHAQRGLQPVFRLLYWGE